MQYNVMTKGEKETTNPNTQTISMFCILHSSFAQRFILFLVRQVPVYALRYHRGVFKGMLLLNNKNPTAHVVSLLEVFKYYFPNIIFNSLIFIKIPMQVVECCN